jgi:predicted small secreted protein
MNSNKNSYHFADTHCAISNRQFQKAFYLLMLGYVLVVACFVTKSCLTVSGQRGEDAKYHLSHTTDIPLIDRLV